MRDGNGIDWDNIRPLGPAVPGRSPCQQGRDEERAAIAAWLLAWAENLRDVYEPQGAKLLDRVVVSIERGEHLAAPSEKADPGVG